MSECWVLEKKDKSKVTKNNVVVAVPRVRAEKFVFPQSSYHLFSQGFVSLYEGETHPQPINIL